MNNQKNAIKTSKKTNQKSNLLKTRTLNTNLMNQTIITNN